MSTGAMARDPSSSRQGARRVSTIGARCVAIYSLDEARLHWPASVHRAKEKDKMMRYRLWSLAAILLLTSLALIACTGNPGGPNTNSAGSKPAEAAQNKNASGASAGATQTAIGY